MSQKPKPVTHRINETALELLDKHPEGVRWTDLNKMIEASDAGFHPKTVIFHVGAASRRLCETFPDRGCEPREGAAPAR